MNEDQKKLVAENRAYFESISDSAVNEFDNAKPCERCKFLGKGCYLTCGVAMKHISRKI